MTDNEILNENLKANNKYLREESMKEICANCVHCHKTKELINKEWKEYYICTLWLDLKEKHEPLLLTLGTEVNRPNVDLCECISLKEQNNG